MKFSSLSLTAASLSAKSDTVKVAKKPRRQKSVKPPASVGERLHRARLKLGCDLLEMEQKTLVRARFLEAIETARFYDLPSVYVFGFVQTYASALGLSPKKILTQFQQEYGLAHRESMHHFGVMQTVSPARFIITPKVMWSGLFGTLVIGLLGYLALQVYNFSGVPLLSLESPAPLSEVVAGEVMVAGKTDPGVTVRIGQELVPVDENGNFSQVIHAEPGTNTISVTAQSRAGKQRTETRSFNVTAARTTLRNAGGGEL